MKLWSFKAKKRTLSGNYLANFVKSTKQSELFSASFGKYKTYIPKYSTKNSFRKIGSLLVSSGE